MRARTSISRQWTSAKCHRKVHNCSAPTHSTTCPQTSVTFIATQFCFKCGAKTSAPDSSATSHAEPMPSTSHWYTLLQFRVSQPLFCSACVRILHYVSAWDTNIAFFLQPIATSHYTWIEVESERLDLHPYTTRRNTRFVYHVTTTTSPRFWSWKNHPHL